MEVVNKTSDCDLSDSTILVTASHLGKKNFFQLQAEVAGETFLSISNFLMSFRTVKLFRS
jgi:hypothetical protein